MSELLTPEAKSLLLDPRYPFRAIIDQLARDLAEWLDAFGRPDPFASRRIATIDRRAAA